MQKAGADREGPPSHLLLVEGPDDQHLLRHLRGYHRLDGKFSVEHGEGIRNLLKSLPVRLLDSDLRFLGIIVDADIDIVARWTSLRDVLIKAGYSSVPQTPEINGTIMQQEEMPTIGIWIMPDNQLPGMIEDFVRLLVPDVDKLWDRAERVVQDIPEEDRLFGIHVMKANIHTWLAWQEYPGTPMGQAITKRYLRADAPQALLLVDWLRRLFDAQLTADAIEET